MTQENYKKQMWKKIDATLWIYSSHMFRRVGELSDVLCCETTEQYRRPPTDLTWEKAEPGRSWGGEWVNFWVKGTAVVPEEAAEHDLYIMPNCNAVEILTFRDGKPCGIINSQGSYIGIMHSVNRIFASAVPGQSCEVALECYAGHYCPGCMPYDAYGQKEHKVGSGEFQHRYNGVTLAVLVPEIRDYLIDLRCVLQCADKLPENNFTKQHAWRILEEVCAEMIQYPADYTEQQLISSAVRCREIMKPFFSGSVCDDGTRGRVGLIGHSHMDTAWVWPVSETIRKCARTYSMALSLMEQYPDYNFIQSSALHLEFMREHYPDIFEEIKRRVAEGRYEPNGGVWVECDCNITSGEFMARQFLHGQLYTRKHFAYTSDTFWLPDTFGYNAAIPQIMRQSAVKYFCTTKISWNDLNPVPYDTFIWRGMDGSEVITHYNLIAVHPDPETLVAAVDQIPKKQVYDAKLLAYGLGDGGGGPSISMMEEMKRIGHISGLPKPFVTTVSGFMRDIERNAHDLPVYDDELYLEFHRGTLTSIHDIKRNNRHAEFALRDMEFFNVLSRRPMCDEDETLVKTLLKNQFHDILPGSSIQPVNELAKKEVGAVINRARELTEEFAAPFADDDTGYITFFNTLSHDRRDDIIINGDLSAGRYITGGKNQYITDICGEKSLVVSSLSVPAFGAVSRAFTDKVPDTASAFTVTHKDGGFIIATPFADVSVGADGMIASFIDRASGRELRKPGGEPLGTFYTCEDLPDEYDNWNIDADTATLKLRPDMRVTSAPRITADGAVQLRIVTTYDVGKSSSVTQEIIFHASSARVDFHLLVDWSDRRTLLKAGFALDIRARKARNEIQFGHVERPTTDNSSLENAKFEVCNHKWTDVSENRFGVALLNDCKYGISIAGCDLRLTLHRGGCHPDMTGDAGLHEMTYSLLPHNCGFSSSAVVIPSYELNIPPVIITGKLQTPVLPPVLTDAANIICEAVKPAELIPDTYVLRFYEAEGTRTSCSFTLPSDVVELREANILEDAGDMIALCDSHAKIEFHPFEIKTFLVTVKSQC